MMENSDRTLLSGEMFQARGRRTRRAGHWPVLLGMGVCVSCVLLGAGNAMGEPPVQPDIAAVLDALGYEPAACEVVCAWHEAVRDGSGSLVFGFHVLPATGSPVDIYTDAAGAFIHPVDLEALGVSPKTWVCSGGGRDAERPTGVAKSQPPPVQPVGASEGQGPTALIELPPIDVERMLAEDASGESTAGKGVMRLGVFQELDPAVRVTGRGATRGAWESLPDGTRLWAGIFYSPEAVGQRIHFSVSVFPEGARVVVYSLSEPEEAYALFDGACPSSSDLWSPTCFSEAVVVECCLPAGTDSEGLEFEIDRTVHIYRDAEEWAVLKSAGACNLDVACYPDWAETALGIGGVGSIGGSGYLWCTGTLLADGDPATALPYFLTANHCVENSTEASSIEVYWRYQRDACGGATPALQDVPRTTGGADYLAGATHTGGTDFAFLRLRNDPPAGLAFVGWTLGPPSVGREVTCIHHPSGDYKRISFGTLMDADDPCDSDPPVSGRFHQVLWHDGTTEPGSSGSPLMLANTQRIIGQLYGGFASCSATDCPDYFGRFRLTFPIVSSWLGNPLDVDGSGAVDVVDLQIVINAFLGFAVAHEPDVDGSGAVDAVDIQLVVRAILGLTG